MTNRKSQTFPLTPYDSQTDIKVMASIHHNSHFSLGKIVFELLDPKELVQIPTEQNEHLRKLGLWNETCFEIFLQFENGHYIEGNFNLAFNWNMFYFKTYRENPLVEWQDIEKNPIKDILLSREKSILIVEFPENIKKIFSDKKITALSLTAVIKLKNGLTHYYAIKHADSKPNFHHPDSFVSFH